MRFFRHKLAVASLIFLIFAGIVAMFPAFFAPHAYDEFDFENIVQGPTLDGWHLFGTDQLGRDYLSRVIFGLQTSLWVALFVGVIATFLGTVVGAIAAITAGSWTTCSCASSICSSSSRSAFVCLSSPPTWARASRCGSGSFSRS